MIRRAARSSSLGARLRRLELAATLGWACACSWDFDRLLVHTSVDQRVRESLSGELERPRPPRVDPEDFTFAAFGDTQIHGDGEHRLARFAQDVGPLGIDFFIVVGDLTNDATEGEMAAIHAALDDVGIPYFVVPGNHDLLERDGWTRYKRHFGPSVYSLVVGQHLKLVMTDSADGTLGETQMEYIERELAGPEPVKVVGGHYPIFESVAPDFWCMSSTAQRYRLESVLDSRDAYAYVAGHLHAFEHTKVEAVHHFVTGSMYPKTLNAGDPAYLLISVRGGAPSWRRIDISR